MINCSLYTFEQSFISGQKYVIIVYTSHIIIRSIMMTVMDFIFHMISYLYILVHTCTYLLMHTSFWNLMTYSIKNKGLKVVFWNVRSLYNKIDSIRLEIYKTNPDIVNINETWLHNDIEDGFASIMEYILIRGDIKIPSL